MENISRTYAVFYKKGVWPWTAAKAGRSVGKIEFYMKRPIFIAWTGLVLGEAAALAFGKSGFFLLALFSLLYVVLIYTGRKQSLFFSRFLRHFCPESPRVKGWKAGMILMGLFMILGLVRYLAEGEPDQVELLLSHAQQAGETCLEGSLEGRVEAVQISSTGKILVMSPGTVFHFGKKVWPCSYRCRVTGTEDGNKTDREEVCPDDRILLGGKLMACSEVENPGEFPAKDYYYANGIRYILMAESLTSMDRPPFSVSRTAFLFGRQLASIYEKCVTERERGLFKAMVLGDKSELSEEIRELYEENGVAHLLAISGLHVSVIGGWIFARLRKRGAGYGLSCLSGGLLLAAYGSMVGFGSSVTRATAMYLIFLLSQYCGADYDIPSSLAFAGCVLLLSSPLRIRESGSILSFASVFAIGMVCPWVKEKLKQRSKASDKTGEMTVMDWELWLRARLGLTLKKGRLPLTVLFLDQLSVSLVISLVTVPLLLRFFYGWSPYSILLNLIVLPAMMPVMLSALGGGLAGSLISLWSIPVGIRVGFALCLPAGMILRLFDCLFRGVRALPFSYLLTGCPPIWQVVLLYCVEAGAAWLWYRRNWRQLAAIGAALCMAMVMNPGRALKMTMLSVGQGECILLRMPGGISMLVDGGSSSRKEIGKYVIRPALKYYGVRQLDFVLITHMDDDHISGIKELLEKDFPVRNLIVPQMGEAEKKDEHFLRMAALAEEKEIRVHRIQQGNRILCGRVRFSCLSPWPGLTSEDRNAYSVVLYLEYGAFDALLTGDVEGEQEEQLLLWIREYENRLREPLLPGLKDGLSLLKVAHHGSRHSSLSDFLEVFRPRTAEISAGKNNRYGHPHKETLDRLKTAGVPPDEIYATPWAGAVELETDGTNFRIGYWRD